LFYRSWRAFRLVRGPREPRKINLPQLALWPVPYWGPLCQKTATALRVQPLVPLLAALPEPSSGKQTNPDSVDIVMPTDANTSRPVNTPLRVHRFRDW
jgi:hypothetical protein